MDEDNPNSDRPAFPLIINEDYFELNYGLTKREYFAAAAMQAILSNGMTMRSIIEAGEDLGMKSEPFVAELAVEYADALIAELDDDK